MALLACDLTPPSISLDDGAAGSLADAGPFSVEHVGETAPPGRVGLPSGSTPRPSDDWASPLECPTRTDPAHCPDCWSWYDGSPQSLDRNSPGDRFGAAIAVADLNGDGYPDLAAGAPGEHRAGIADAGAVYLYLGSPRGFQPWRTLTDDSQGGPIADARFGAHLHAVDVDADGRAELFVGYGGAVADTPIFGFSTSSAGVDLRWFWRTSDLDPGGSVDPSGVGSALTSGDFDHDGDVDVALGAPARGKVYLLENVAGELSAGAAISGPGVDFGVSVATTRADELVVGSSTEEKVRVYDDGTLVMSYGSALPLAGFGRFVEAIDLDGDEVDELLVSGWNAAGVEIAGTSHTLTPTAVTTPLSTRVMAGGDLVLNGHPELVLTHVNTDGTRQVLLFKGDGTFEPGSLYEMHGGAGAELADELGESAAIVDTDGDGLLDLLLGAPGGCCAASGGRVYSFLEPGGADRWAAMPEPTQTVEQETGLSATCDRCTVHATDDGHHCDADGSGDEICVAGACVTRECGDGYREPAGSSWGREGCDDGNASDADLCSSACEAHPYAVAASSGGRDHPFGPRFTAGVDGRGATLLVWASEVGGGWSILARRFDEHGVALGDGFTVRDGLTLGVDASPSVAGLSGGGWVVAWSEPAGDGVDAGILVRIVSADGVLGGPIVANTETALDQLQPTVAALGDGFVLAWTDTSQSLLDGPARRVVSRRFDATGRASAPERVVAADISDQAEPSIAAAGDRYLVAWVEHTGDPADPTRVLARRFERDGPVDAGDLTLASTRASEVSVATLANGEFVAVWRDGSLDPYGDIHARRVAAATDPALFDEPEVVVSSSDPGRPWTTADFAPSVAPLSGADYLVVHQTFRNERGLGLAVSPGAVEPTERMAAAGLLADDTAGDGAVVASPGGLWLVYSTGTDPGGVGAYRSTLAYRMAVD